MIEPEAPSASRRGAEPSGIGDGASSPVEVLAAGEDGPAPAASWFERIVRPLAAQEFLDTRYRDKRPVLFQARGPRFASLCTWDALNGLLSSPVWQDRMRLVRRGSSLREHYYTAPYFGHGWRARRQGSNDRRIDDGRLAGLLRKGATIMMHSLQDLHPPLVPLADALEEALGCYVDVKLFASWVATRGLATHWDDHDVIVLQVTGAKRWHLYGETRRFPLPRDAEPNVGPPPEMVWSGVLRAGDVLYVPRGWWHDARVEPGDDGDGAGSLHLTCSIFPATGLDFMEWLTGRLARHEAFRRDLPHPTDGAGDAHYAALRELVVEELQGDLGRRFRDHLRSTWSERPRMSFGPSVEPWKSPDWERYGLRLRGASHAAMQRTGDGDVVLEANGYRWTLDGRCMDLMAPLLRGEVVRVGAFRAGAVAEGAASEGAADGAAPEGVASEGATADEAASTSFADELARLLVMRGIVQAFPPDPVSGT